VRSPAKILQDFSFRCIFRFIAVSATTVPQFWDWILRCQIVVGKSQRIRLIFRYLGIGSRKLSEMSWTSWHEVWTQLLGIVERCTHCINLKPDVYHLAWTWSYNPTRYMQLKPTQKRSKYGWTSSEAELGLNLSRDYESLLLQSPILARQTF